MQHDRLIRSLFLGLVPFAGPLLAAAPDSNPLKLVLQAPPALGVSSVSVSPDGSLVATAAGEGGVRIYDARSGELLRVIGGAGDRCVVFSPDGKMLTAAGFHMDKLSALWDVQSGKRLQTFAGHTEWEVDATAISPDGKLLASTGVDKQVLVWEIGTGKLRHQIKDQPTRLAALAFSPDSAVLAGGGGDKAVKLWDMATGQLRRTLEGHGDWICTLAFSPDGELIASGSCEWGLHRGHDWPRAPSREEERSEWRLWEVATGKLRHAMSEKGRILSLAFAPDGKSVACGVRNLVKLYEFPIIYGDVTGHYADVTAVAFTPDGAAIISGSHDQMVRRTNLRSRDLEWQAPGIPHSNCPFPNIVRICVNSAPRKPVITAARDQ